MNTVQFIILILTVLFVGILLYRKMDKQQLDIVNKEGKFEITSKHFEYLMIVLLELIPPIAKGISNLLDDEGVDEEERMDIAVNLCFEEFFCLLNEQAEESETYRLVNDIIERVGQDTIKTFFKNTVVNLINKFSNQDDDADVIDYTAEEVVEEEATKLNTGGGVTVDSVDEIK
jgi:hypothetical protein